MVFEKTYRGKRVLITGHTGFKGSWLAEWLLSLGAEICGLSRDVPTTPAHFELNGLASEVQHNICDIRDIERAREIVMRFKPDFIFHLAAQATVSTSYHDPIDTVQSNVLGTTNTLQILRDVDWPVSVVMITSDKCYENVEWIWGYRENDRVGGKDIYSASKAAADIIISAFYRTYFAGSDSPVRLASARAGNVIGGGDWAKDRIVADCVRAWTEKQPVVIRAPNATRPWQHVLEPLSGYLLLAERLSTQAPGLLGEPFNFGPAADQNVTVRALIERLAEKWGYNDPKAAYEIQSNETYNEAGLLKLNCDKALARLNWSPVLHTEECIDMTAQGYVHWHDGSPPRQRTHRQIELYTERARERQHAWAS